MLVLSRKEHERIYIGDNVFVEVVEIRGGKVRLGVVAPKDVPVERKEDVPVERKEIFDVKSESTADQNPGEK